ncbi:MAG: hypothetical protein WC312_07975, partial [Candidatus Omnitrophota bacterium]
QDRKEEVKQYVTKINPIIINIQIATRNISQKFLTYGLAAEQMSEYHRQLRAVKPPVYMARQHKMVLLSLRKMGTGFYLLSKGDRTDSVTLVRRGAELLRIAVKDIVGFAREEGLVKETIENNKIGNARNPQQKPILPPIVHQGTPMVSPTPYITVPRIQSQVINPMTQQAVPSHISNSPTISVPVDMPQVPVADNAKLDSKPVETTSQDSNTLPKP